MIDPSRDNPADFISFHEEFAFPLEDNIRGHTTIEVLGLNSRKDLVERRRERIQILRVLQAVVTLLPHTPVATEAQEILNEAKMYSGEYAAMSRAFLQ